MKTSFSREQLLYKVKNKIAPIARAHEYMFFGPSQTKKCFHTFPRAPQARAEKISAILVIITCKIPFVYPLRDARGVQTPSNDFRGYGTPSDPTRGSKLTPSRCSRGSKPVPPRRGRGGQTHPLGPSFTPQGGLCVTLASVYIEVDRLCFSISADFTCLWNSQHDH